MKRKRNVILLVSHCYIFCNMFVNVFLANSRLSFSLHMIPKVQRLQVIPKSVFLISTCSVLIKSQLADAAGLVCRAISNQGQVPSPASDINTLSLNVSRRGLPFLITTFSTHGHLPAGVAKFLKIVKIKGENRVRVLAIKLLKKQQQQKLYVHDFN